MPVPVYVGKRITVSLTGGRNIECICEKCPARYRYERIRAVTGSAEAAYYVGQAAAARRAEKRAAKALAAALEHSADLVACPKCNWVNQSSVIAYRQRRYRNWTLGAFVAGILASAGVMIASAIISGADPAGRLAGPGSFGIAVVFGVVVVVATLLLRRALRNRINPNLFHPLPPKLPPGMPIAVLLDANGQPILQSLKKNAEPWTGWVTFQTGKNFLPEACCECLGKPETVFSMPFKVNEGSDVAVPLCRPCFRTLRKRWWKMAFLSFAGAVALSTFILLIPGGDTTGRFTAFGIVGGFLGLVLVAIVPAKLVQPCKMKTIDASRAIFALCFRNEAYTRLINDQQVNLK